MISGKMKLPIQAPTSGMQVKADLYYNQKPLRGIRAKHQPALQYKNGQR